MKEWEKHYYATARAASRERQKHGHTLEFFAGGWRCIVCKRRFTDNYGLPHCEVEATEPEYYSVKMVLAVKDRLEYIDGAVLEHYLGGQLESGPVRLSVESIDATEIDKPEGL